MSDFDVFMLSGFIIGGFLGTWAGFVIAWRLGWTR